MFADLFNSDPDGKGDFPARQSCDCQALKQFQGIVLAVTIPMAIMYLFLMFLGIVNLVKFNKLHGISKNLGLIYFWSLLSDLCWAVYFSLVLQTNQVVYVPYAVALYSKIEFGIFYQASIFDLKYMVQFYFKQNMVEKQFEARRRRMDTYIGLLATLVILVALSDIGINYVWYTMLDEVKSTGKDNKEPPTTFMVFTYCFVGVMFIILTGLILVESTQLVSMTQIVGERLAKERKNLKILMITFAISYSGIAIYYMLLVINDRACTHAESCTRFADLMAKCTVLFFCDIIPTSVLYSQHYRNLRKSEAQLEEVNMLRTQSTLDYTKTGTTDELGKIVFFPTRADSDARLDQEKAEICYLERAFSSNDCSDYVPGSSQNRAFGSGHNLQVVIYDDKGVQRNLNRTSTDSSEESEDERLANTSSRKGSIPMTIMGSIESGEKSQFGKGNASHKRRSRTINASQFAIIETDNSNLFNQHDDISSNKDLLADQEGPIPTSQSLIENQIDREDRQYLVNSRKHKSGRIRQTTQQFGQNNNFGLQVLIGCSKQNFIAAAEDYKATTNSRNHSYKDLTSKDQSSYRDSISGSAPRGTVLKKSLKASSPTGTTSAMSIN